MRVFRCSCGHKMRFGAARCGRCYDHSPFYNRRETWVTAAAAAGTVFLVPVVLSFG
jgi:hypothetical protein